VTRSDADTENAKQGVQGGVLLLVEGHRREVAQASISKHDGPQAGIGHAECQHDFAQHDQQVRKEDREQERRFAPRRDEHQRTAKRAHCPFCGHHAHDLVHDRQEYNVSHCNDVHAGGDKSDDANAPGSIATAENEQRCVEHEHEQQRHDVAR